MYICYLFLTFKDWKELEKENVVFTSRVLNSSCTTIKYFIYITVDGIFLHFYSGISYLILLK